MQARALTEQNICKNQLYKREHIIYLLTTVMCKPYRMLLIFAVLIK